MPGYNPDDYNLAGAFAEIEHELMESMMRNMRRHQKEEEQEGIEWSQWQAEQLRDLERYRLENKDKFTEDFKAINDMIADMIRQARATGKADEEISILEAIQMGWNRGKKKKGVSGEFFKQNDRKMNALIKATTQDMEKAEHAILRKANDEYRKTIFNAVAIANTGSLGYDKCIDIATRDMRRAGLRCVEYKNGSRHSLEDYADMVIKTTTKRAYLTGEGEMRAEWGISTVILNKRSSACPLCLPWVGKVMIDDVWSNGGKGDGKYPLLSHAIAEGLYHPRCKDSHTTFFPGISTEDSKWTKKELQQLEEENKTEAKQKEAERQAKVHEREAEFALDPEEKKAKQALTEQILRQADLESGQPNRIVEGYEENDRSVAESVSSYAKGNSAGVWPQGGTLIEKDKLDSLIMYGKERGIKLANFENYDGDVKLLEEFIDQLDDAVKDFPSVVNGRKQFRLQLSFKMDDHDYAVTNGSTITINGFVFRSREALKRDYEDKVIHNWFAKDTDYRSIATHEAAHVITNVYQKKYAGIFTSINAGKTRHEIKRTIIEQIGEYATQDEKELIAEAFSQYKSGNRSELVLNILGFCGIL